MGFFLQIWQLIGSLYSRCDYNKYTIKVLREMATIKKDSNNLEYTNDDLMLMQTSSANDIDIGDDYESYPSE